MPLLKSEASNRWQGADVIYDGLGQAAAKENFAALAMRGHWVSYGQASGPLQSDELGRKNRERFPNRSSFISLPLLQEMAGERVQGAGEGTIRVEVRQRYPPAASDAHRDLEARRTSGQVVLLT
jgi:NADPH:quinone reductase-like Zn-dependent oxidoreductase